MVRALAPKPPRATVDVLTVGARVTDRATTEHPHSVSEGIVKVWVNGALAWADGRVTPRRAGTVIRRQ